MKNAVIEFLNVTKRFGRRTVLDGLSFEVRKGEILAVIGPSGTGKSVMLKHVAGLLEPDAGEVRLSTDRIGYLFQSGALLAWMTVAENIALPLRETMRLSEREIDRRVSQALESVGLTEAADRYPSEISGGMQKRAGLARAIVREADVVLYDEPTSGLDPVTSAHIVNLIRDINAARGVTSVVVTHDLDSAIRIASRILMLKDGRAVVCEPPESFLRSSVPDVVEFIAATKGQLK